MTIETTRETFYVSRKSDVHFFLGSFFGPSQLLHIDNPSSDGVIRTNIIWQNC